MALYSTILYGSGNFYTGSGEDKPIELNFYRTDTDNQYVFHWTFQQAFISPLIKGFDYQLQLDTDPNFSAPVTYETSTEAAAIQVSGYSKSGESAATNIGVGLTLDIDIDADQVQTIILAVNVTGATIAADIQAKVQALIANDPAKQGSYNSFTATFNATNNQYTLTSGGVGLTSSVVITGGTAATALKLGVAAGGTDVIGNATVLSQLPRRVLIVENTSTTFLDVTSTASVPGPDQYRVNLSTGVLTFNDSNVGDTIAIVFVPDTSGDIVQYQRGNVAKGFTIPIFDRIDTDRLTFYARIRIKDMLTYGPYSDVLTAQTLALTIKDTADRLLNYLPDRHVYPTDEAYKPLADRTTNLAVIYETYAREFDRLFLEKEHTIRDPRQERMRDPRLYNILGVRYSYPKPSTMEFVDYRIVVSNVKAAQLNGGTYDAAKLVGRAFTGVDPDVIPFSRTINFITASETLSIDRITVPLVGPYTSLLSSGVSRDPIIPGALISGPTTTVSEPAVIPIFPGPYTVSLVNLPDDIPSITGFAYTTDVPAVGEFTVDFSTGVLTFNAADAGTAINTIYTPYYDVGSNTIFINIDGDGVRTITLDVGPFESKLDIAANIQAKVRALVAITPSNQPSYDNFLANYYQNTDTFILISGNQIPTISSTVVVTGGTAASKLKLLVINGADSTTGLQYKTPPGPPSASQFINDIDTGDGSLLTFDSTQFGKNHIVIYKSINNIYSYTPHTTSEAHSVPLVSPYTVTLATLSVNIPSITGFTYTTGIPTVGQFTVDFSTGVLAFNVADAGTAITVDYVSKVPRPPTIYSRTEAGFAIKIVLNNPGNFTLDKTNIAHLMEQVLPAHTKFILI